MKKPYFKWVNLHSAAEGPSLNIDSDYGTDDICRLLAYDDHTGSISIKRRMDMLFIVGYPSHLVDKKRRLKKKEVDHIKKLKRRDNHSEYYILLALTIARKICDNQEIFNYILKTVSENGSSVKLTSYKVVNGKRRYNTANSAYIYILNEMFKTVSLFKENTFSEHVESIMTSRAVDVAINMNFMLHRKPDGPSPALVNFYETMSKEYYFFKRSINDAKSDIESLKLFDRVQIVGERESMYMHYGPGSYVVDEKTTDDSKQQHKRNARPAEHVVSDEQHVSLHMETRRKASIEYLKKKKKTR